MPGLNVKIGDCYLHSASKTAALLYLQKAAKLDVTADARTHFLLARALHMSAKFPEALAEYQQARPVGGNTRNGSADNLTANDLQRYMKQCRTGQLLMAHPVRVFIDNAGPELNSSASDYAPVISADEATIFITSRRARWAARRTPRATATFKTFTKPTGRARPGAAPPGFAGAE